MRIACAAGLRQGALNTSQYASDRVRLSVQVEGKMEVFETLLPILTLLGGWLLGLFTLYVSEAVVEHAKGCLRA